MSRSSRHPFALLAPTIVLVLSVACGDPAGVAPVDTPTPTPVSHEVAVRAIAVTPGALALHPGWLDSVTVVLTDSAGNALTGRTVTFAIDDPYVATIRDGGVVAGAAAGSTTLRVTSEGVTVRVPVILGESRRGDGRWDGHGESHRPGSDDDSRHERRPIEPGAGDRAVT